ncbi:pitrilysin family protein [Anaeromyxobacter sp. PSR-1]|uniref:M16 family metallopeptidase n=1 Tax=Anaeromyxobacter sp. PSR-1 TaxID=1300915 RepID=UPI0005E58E44|nr:pitrilysin family protein [Anaeromyxobacter sp. PSR-1]GAO03255.1 putative zinc protease y4wA [Anaeromyxobacter sp. PSR-1]
MLAPLATLAALALALAAGPAAPPLELTTFSLPNGLTVVLAPDHRLPQVAVDTWFQVGSKDEAPARTGFAHLFEHLMFMGTNRVPGNRFDVIMESGGGSNNASTSSDRTNYYSVGPSQLLPTLLWLDADRLQALADAMTQEKLDLQRGVVRNERRQSYENTPYGAAELVIPEVMYPDGHPYHHPVIGSHADLEAATLDDVKGFFRTWYVPANATLVVAGDFRPDEVRPLVEKLFGAVPLRAPPAPARAAPARLEREVRRILSDRVELPKLILVWHAPAAYADGSAELELLADVLAEGPSSRLDRRLVQDLRLAESVTAYLDPGRLGSLFRVEVTATPGADLERVKREALAVLAELQAKGPEARELARVRAQAERRRREEREHLVHRADKLNEYLSYYGEPDGFARDLARVTSATSGGLREAARGLGEGRLDLRVLPARAGVAKAEIPDAPPPPLATRPFDPPAPEVFRLANGLEVRVAPRPGTGLFAAHLLLPGGAAAVPAEKAGLAPILAELLTSGAGGRSAAEYADAIRALGATVEAEARPASLQVSVSGLSAHLAPALDLFADAVLRPNLARADFEREAALALARVEARPDDPRKVAPVAAAAAIFGRNDPRGRPVDGWAATVRTVTLDDVRRLAPRLLDPRGATLVVAGDVDPAALRRLLAPRLGAWRGAGPAPAANPAALTAAPGGRILLVDRPGAPQTRILLARPVAPAAEPARALRELVNVVLGGSFTSRLNQNLREKHGYTYGARSAFATEGGQGLFTAGAAVQTEVTGAALVELRRELDGLAAAGVDSAETAKARETARHRTVEEIQTTAGLADALAAAVLEGRPPDALRREAEALAAVEPARAVAEAKTGPYAFGGLTVVLVGDRKAVVPQLEKAGFPRPVVVDAEGIPVPAIPVPE